MTTTTTTTIPDIVTKNMRQKFASHPHHLTNESPWPIITSWSVLAMLSSYAIWFNGVVNSEIWVVLGTLSTTVNMTLWWADVTKESTLIGLHTKIVQENHAIGFGLFLVTETFVFVSIFWAYFHSSLAPTVELGIGWPPTGITALSPMTVPLINTMLLISSGAAITYGHHAFIKIDRDRILSGVIYTIILAVIFTAFQAIEYKIAGFTISDGAYGSVFYFGTGVHGAHVIIGTIFITVAFVRAILYHFTKDRHTGLESPIVYWHFVDVVWIALYLCVYWWGSSTYF